MKKFDISKVVNADVAPDAKAMNEVKKWLEETDLAERREKDWRKSGKEVICLYEADRKTAYQFNILYSNTETLAPALYSTTPTTVVQRRFKDDDPVGLEASKVIQRTLTYSLDNGQAIYASFDSLMTSAVLSALVPGRGVTRFKYDAYIEETKPEAEGEAPGIEAGEAEVTAGRTLPGIVEEEVASGAQVKWEAVCGESIPWDRFCHGYGQTWQEVPWVAYKWPMTREELIRNFGQEIGSKVNVTSVSSKELDSEKTQGDDMLRGMKVAWVYEIWDKSTKEVVFISEGYPNGPLKKVPDPLNLTGFFSCPQPLTFFSRVSGLTPQTLYAFYEEQAKELNQVTARIGRMIKALKVRGIYDGSIDALGQIFSEDDNALLPADNTTAMYDRGGLEKAIWFLPIDKIILVLQQLYAVRQQTKQVIYEVTGLSDILRGTSNPNETLGAQKIKDQWGNLRLRKLQKRTQTYVVDSLRIMAEIACGKFGLETFKEVTNLKFPSAQDKAAIQQQLPMIQDPAMQAQAQEVLQTPAWEEILAVLQNDLQRSYRIDIETNSTIEPEATEDKESMMGLMNALSQFLLGIQPLVQDGSLPFEAMKAMMLTICRRFNFGDQVEDELKKMQAPQPPAQVDPALEQQKSDLATQQKDLEAQHAQMALDQTKNQLEVKFQQKIAAMEQQLQQAQMALVTAKQTNDLAAEQQAAQAEMKLQQTISALTIRAEHVQAQQERQHQDNLANNTRTVQDHIANANTQGAKE